MAMFTWQNDLHVNLPFTAMNPASTSSKIDTIADAQLDMRNAYCGGAPGVLASGLVWLAAGVTALNYPVERAIWTLLIAAMFIHPLSIVFNKVLGRSGKHASTNPLAGLAMASTFWMIMCIPLAYAISTVRPDLFFPAMLLIIGGRYLTFATLYGSNVYWACGAVLGLAAIALGKFGATPAAGAFAGAAIEIAFAAAVFAMSGRAPGVRTAEAG